MCLIYTLLLQQQLSKEFQSYHSRLIRRIKPQILLHLPFLHGTQMARINVELLPKMLVSDSHSMQKERNLATT